LIAVLLAVVMSSPPKHLPTTDLRKVSAVAHLAAKTHKSMRLKKRKNGEDDEDCNSCNNKEDKKQDANVAELKADVMSLTTVTTELKTTITTMSSEIETLKTEITTLKECCKTNQENIKKQDEEPKKDWDKNVNRMAKAKLLRNYKPDWTTYISKNYPLDKQQKALEALGDENMKNSKTQMLTSGQYDQFVGGTAEKQRRIFSLVDLGEKVQLSQILAWSSFNNMLFMTKVAAHYYTKDDAPNLDAPNPNDFKQLVEVRFQKTCGYKAQGGQALWDTPVELNFPPIETRYLWLDLNNEEDKIGCKCVTVSGWKAFS